MAEKLEISAGLDNFDYGAARVCLKNTRVAQIGLCGSSAAGFSGQIEFVGWRVRVGGRQLALSRDEPERSRDATGDPGLFGGPHHLEFLSLLYPFLCSVLLRLKRLSTS